MAPPPCCDFYFYRTLNPYKMDIFELSFYIELNLFHTQKRYIIQKKTTLKTNHCNNQISTEINMNISNIYVYLHIISLYVHFCPRAVDERTPNRYDAIIVFEWNGCGLCVIDFYQPGLLGLLVCVVCMCVCVLAAQELSPAQNDRRNHKQTYKGAITRHQQPTHMLLWLSS